MRWIVMVMMVLPGCKAPTAGGDEIRIGYFPNLTHGPAVVGLAVGGPLHGLGKIKTSLWNAGPSEMQAMHAGALDLAFVGPTPALTAAIRGKGDVMLLGGVAAGGSVLVVRDGAEIDSVSQLAGRKIAVPQTGNTQDLLLRVLLRDHRILIREEGGSTVLAPIENPEVLALMIRGEIDAACVPEPWASRLEIEAKAKAIYEWPSAATTVLVGRAAWIDEHRTLARRFLDAVGAIKPSAREVGGQLAKLTGKAMPSEILSRAANRVHWTTRLDAKELTIQIVQLKALRYVPELVPLTRLVYQLPTR